MCGGPVMTRSPIPLLDAALINNQVPYAWLSSVALVHDCDEHLKEMNKEKG